ncbi:YolD-like family protein [Fictibacillus terranigra]|uniref:YolD-like family protein n=1 Tax=Fictibacillus terranigra TaxID=3058424 RepID=A0ABT8E8K8_9BACL|nr:YolD-like family protein [Fictibacillus sp. CENA-BCM004]MDN4074209.1 YolD-like family protein [Fictibacillus sp. CENA-BCM004]
MSTIRFNAFSRLGSYKQPAPSCLTDNSSSADVIRDRGDIKRKTSLMLPETVSQLNHWFLKEYYEEEEPFSDEQQLEEMNEWMLDPMEFAFPLNFSVVEKGLSEIKGMIHYMDESARKLRILDKGGQLRHLSLKNIKNISKADQ